MTVSFTLQYRLLGLFVIHISVSEKSDYPSVDALRNPLFGSAAGYFDGMFRIYDEARQECNFSSLVR